MPKVTSMEMTEKPLGSSLSSQLASHPGLSKKISSMSKAEQRDFLTPNKESYVSPQQTLKALASPSQAASQVAQSKAAGSGTSTPAKKSTVSTNVSPGRVVQGVTPSSLMPRLPYTGGVLDI